MPAARTHQDATCIDPRLLSAPSSVNLPPPSRSTHARVRSSSSSSNPGHIPRPPNAFFIFRSEMIGRHKLKKLEHDQRNISRIVSHLWNDLPENEKEHYRQAAEVRKMQHSLEHPDYKYQPNTAPESSKEKRRRVGVEDEAARARKVAQDLMLGYELQAYPSSASSHVASGHNGVGYSVMNAPPRDSHSHHSSAPHYPSSSTTYLSTPHYPSSSTSSTSHHAYPSTQPHYSGPRPYPEHQYRPSKGNEAPTDAQLQHFMGQFNH